MTTVKFMLVQKTEVNPVNGFDGEPHFGETPYETIAELVEDLASGQDNNWTYQVLAVEFDGNLVVGMQDISQNVCNLVEAVSWTNAQMGLPVHPMALRGSSGGLVEFLEDKAEAASIAEKYLGCKMPTAAKDRLVELGAA